MGWRTGEPAEPAPNPPRKFFRSIRDPGLKTRFATLTALTLIAAWLRFSGAGFGIPGLFRPDEEYMINPALSFVNDWNPHYAIYPAAQMYVQHAALWAYAAALGRSSNFRSLYEGGSYPMAHVVARWVSAAFGTATVPAIYFAGAPAFGPTAALASAAIVACSTIHVLNSKFATTDVAAVFWLVLALAMLLRVARNYRLRDCVSAGFFSGIATATKYPAAAIAFGIAAAHMGGRRRAGGSLIGFAADPRMYMAGLVMFAAFFCASPYVLLDWAQTVRDYTYQRPFVLEGVSAAGYGWRWLFLHVMRDCFGIGMEALMLAALVWAVFRREAGTLSTLAFVGVTFTALLSSHQLFYRYILVPFPAMALLAGILVADLVGFAATRLGKRCGGALVMAGFALLLAPSLIRDIQLDLLLNRTDTRILALRWIEHHIERGSAIAEIDETTLYGKPPLRSSYRVVPFEDPKLLRAKGVTWVVSDSYPPLFYSRGPSADELAALNAQAILMFDVDPILNDAPVPIFDPNDAFYAPLQHLSSVTRPGPRIRIWKLK